MCLVDICAVVGEAARYRRANTVVGRRDLGAMCANVYGQLQNQSGIKSLREIVLRSRQGLYLFPESGYELLNGTRFGDIWSKPWCLPDGDPSKRLQNSDIAFMFFEWSPYSKNQVGSNDSLVPHSNDADDGNCYYKDDRLPGKIVKGQQVFGFRCTGPWRPSDLDSDEPLNHLSPLNIQYPGLRASCWLDGTDLRRFELCSKALHQHNPEINRHDLYESKYPFVDTLSDCVGDLPSLTTIEAMSPEDGKITISAFGGISVAVFLYGGLHLLAWNAPFASTHQKALWRMSGICVAFSGILGLAMRLPLKKNIGVSMRVYQAFPSSLLSGLPYPLLFGLSLVVESFLW